jgi:hypothetical protein
LYKCVWFESIVIHYKEVSIHSSKRLNETPNWICIIYKLFGNQWIMLSVSGSSLHDIKFWVFISERDSRIKICTKANQDHENSW